MEPSFPPALDSPSTPPYRRRPLLWLLGVGGPMLALVVIALTANFALRAPSRPSTASGASSNQGSPPDRSPSPPNYTRPPGDPVPAQIERLVHRAVEGSKQEQRAAIAPELAQELKPTEEIYPRGSRVAIDAGSWIGAKHGDLEVGSLAAVIYLPGKAGKHVEIGCAKRPDGWRIIYVSPDRE